jgi:small-conductance mechanosensitive channel
MELAMMPHPIHRFCWLLLALTLLVSGAPFAYAEDNGEWPLVLEALRKQDQMVRARLQAFKERHAHESAERTEAVEQLLRDRARLAFWQSTASDPWEIRDVLAGFARLRFDVEQISNGPEQTWASLEQNAAVLESYRERLVEITRQEVPERFQQELFPPRQSIEALTTAITTERDALAVETAPLRVLAEQIKTAEQTLQASLPPAWKAYYTTRVPSPLSSSYIRVLQQDMEDWLLTLNLGQELLQTSSNRRLLRSTVLHAVAATLLSAILGFTVIYLARRKGLPRATGDTLAKVMACLAPGGSLLLLAQHAPFFLYSPLASIGECLLAAALVHLSRLRRSDDHSSPRPPLLWPTWRLFSLGLLLEALRFPDSLLSPVMAGILAYSAFAFYKRYKSTPPAQRLNRGATRTLAVLLPLLSLLSIAGLPQTAILCASGLFYTALALRFAATSTHLLGRKEMDRLHGHPPAFLGLMAGVGFPVFFLMYLFVFLWMLSTQFGGENVFLEILTTETRIESVGISLKKIAILFAGFYLAKAGIALSATFIGDVVNQRRAVERGAKSSLLTINTYAWWGLYCIFGLAELGLSLTSVAVVAGGLSVGIGFGMQTMVNNFISGLILLFGRSILAGDTIQLGDAMGVVKEVNIRNTEVLTRDNATIFVPNSELISGKITNWSHKDPSVRRDVCIGVAYGSDTAKVRKLLLEAASSCPAVLTDPTPTVLHWDFGPSTLDFRLRVWLANVDKENASLSAIREAIDRLFREAGIEIAFPQTDLHLRTAPALDQLFEHHRQEAREQFTELTNRLTALEKKIHVSQTPNDSTKEDAPHDA